MAVTAVLVLAAGTIQIILWTDWPRQFVERKIEKQTGCRVAIDSFETSWTGRSVLRDITMTAGDDETPRLRIPHVRVRHTALVPLVFTRSISLSLVEVDEPHMLVVQEHDGVRDVAGVIEKLRRRSESDDPEQSNSKTWPAVTVNDAVIELRSASEESSGNGNPREVTIQFDGYISGGTCHVSAFDPSGTGGSASGEIEIPIANWEYSRASLEFRNVDVGWFRQCWSVLQGATGQISGTLAAEPAPEQRSPESLRVTLTLDLSSANIASLTTDTAEITMFAGRDRLIIDRTELIFGEGIIELWGQASWHETDPVVHLNARLEELSLDQLIRLADSSAEPAAGRVSGEATLGGHLRAPQRWSGQADVRITQADLTKVPVISLLYDALNLKIGEPKPEGEGLVSLRLEGGSLEIGRFEYFNRGVDIVAHGRIENIEAGRSSPVTGFAAGAVRPLKKIDLPVFRDVDALLGAIQSDIGAVRITGTVGEYEMKAVPFTEIRSALGAVLGGSKQQTK